MTTTPTHSPTHSATVGRSRSVALAGCTILLAAVSTGCPKLTPVQELEARRAEYSAEVQNFYPVESEPEVVVTEGEGTEDEGTEEAPIELSQPEPPVILVDVLISTTAREKLDGLTIDVSHGDSQGNEKEVRRIWIDTSDIERGSGAQVTLRLEDLDYVEGDGFHAQVRSPIPESERSEYREFSSIGE